MPRDLLVPNRNRLKLLLTNRVEHVDNFDQTRPRSYLQPDSIHRHPLSYHPSLLVVLPTLPSRLLAPLGDLILFLLDLTQLELLFLLPKLAVLPLLLPTSQTLSRLTSPNLRLCFERQLLGNHLGTLVPRQLGTLVTICCLHL